MPNLRRIAALIDNPLSIFKKEEPTMTESDTISIPVTSDLVPNYETIIDRPETRLYDRNGTPNAEATRQLAADGTVESDLAIAPLDPIGPIGDSILDARMAALERHNSRLSNSVFQVLEIEDNMPVLFDTQNSDAYVLMPLDRYLKTRHRIQAMKFNLKQINLRLHELKSHNFRAFLTGEISSLIGRRNSLFESVHPSPEDTLAYTFDVQDEAPADTLPTQ